MSIKITIPNSSSDVLTFGSGNTPTAAQIAGIDSGSSNGQLALYTTASGTSTERVRVDASGNVGIGVTPSTWTTFKAIEFGTGNGHSLFGSGGAGGETHLGTNVYYNSGYKYANTDLATDYKQTNGTHAWFNAPSGTAGNTISFTQAMTLDSSGTLLIGRTAASTSKLAIQTVDTTSSNFAAIFQDSATVNLFYVRNDGVGYLKAASWTYGSDISLKENVRYLDSNNSLSLITKAKPASFDYINSQKENYGFIAQDVQTWFPEAVVETEGGTLGLKTEFFTPLMVGSIQALNNLIQEQQAIITSLTDRITLLESK
ncbi:Intramolecular chaperone auto-processing domain containing protein [uncultured Caudovirales phage]|uniref:Intramolecular chaperone auto-processing domain containing protein n=1 Tax=uncultured Caudovirales phage TaxID=2100421 RepID=A0A6J7WH05_9CAUD|nr:Intramolecular chaperone auto-processing domain containing protein [uncultured Caudovirales phage]